MSLFRKDFELPKRRLNVDVNGGSRPNYSPNRRGGPSADPRASEAAIALDGASGRTEYPQANHADDFEQAGLLYSVLSRDEHTRLVNNIVGHMSGIDVEIQRRQVVHFLKANMEYGNRVAEGLKIKV